MAVQRFERAGSEELKAPGPTEGSESQETAEVVEATPDVETLSGLVV